MASHQSDQSSLSSHHSASLNGNSREGWCARALDDHARGESLAGGQILPAGEGVLTISDRHQIPEVGHRRCTRGHLCRQITDGRRAVVRDGDIDLHIWKTV